MVLSFKLLFSSLATVNVALSSATQNQTRYNPALPGWHSDPSCVFVPEWDNTTFCTSSTLRLTPGLPIYVSRDLTNWKLISHALSRKSQYPEYDQSLAQSDGIWAPTIRYHKGTFYIITIYNNQALGKATGLIFKSTDPYSDCSWSDPIRYDAKTIDPDIFWDDDGTAYVATAGTNLQTLDTETGVLGEPRVIWNGTTGIYLEGPHLYKKDGYYYLLTAEGGSGLNHSVTMARSTNIWGPYESHPHNPVLTNRNTSAYFQNIGHADLFPDASGNWWSSALAWRSGPAGRNYPMGREMVLTTVTWPSGAWPTFAPVRGVQSGWPLPPSPSLPGAGPLTSAPDAFDFAPNTSLPRNLATWGWPDPSAYAISPPGHPHTLRLTPSPASITDGHANYTAGYDIANRTLLLRRQTHTLFEFSIDLSFAPTALDEEAGVTVFLNDVQNIALGVVMLRDNATATLAPHLRLLASGIQSNAADDDDAVPAPVVLPMPRAWRGDAVRLSVRAENETHYAFYAAGRARPADARAVAWVPATVVSGGVGPFTGSLVGVYATSNHGNGTAPAYISRWRYHGLGQAVGNGVIVPSDATELS
ncbi:Glycoside hydrolase family 43 [Macrophomina phaseolina MS6]|uniref:Glycoside hydrolase family 43 n=1 Tax=Macrophomina phaseolina (strain MS6) TaxID=1126212 RepID=K2RMA7_MACPH|nr:Glycoside hydrolase family 43 [Macrophomina phaseolina MS6]